MNSLQPIEYKEQRVLTTAQLAEGYGTNGDIISKNFSRNDARYVEGKHFYRLKGEHLRAFLSNGQIDGYSKNTPFLYLWTERGALLHAKSLNTEKAWEVYDILVETYFRAKEMFNAPKTLSEALYLAASLQKQIEENQPLIAFAETVSRSEKSLLIREFAKLCCKDGFDTGEKRLYKRLRDWRMIMPDSCEPYQEYVNRGYFEVTEGAKDHGEKVHIFKTTRVMPKGQIYIIDRLKREAVQ